MESKLLAFMLLPSGVIHNGNTGFALLISFLILYLAPKEAELSGRELQYGEALGFGLAYLIHGPLMLLMSKNLKKVFARDRPAAP